MVEELKAPLLEISKLTKSFGGTVVLDRVDLNLQRGEIRALLGENGAGKSTLIKLLSGVYQPDSGIVRISGSPKIFRNPHASAIAGIATVHQELMISPGLSVAENVLLGTKIPTRLGKISWTEVNRRAQQWFAELGQEIDVRKPVDGLTPVQMTMTALARALAQNAQILILDEPTAALTDAEVSQLFGSVQRLSDRGVAVLYVSHRLEEVFVLAQTYTVLRNGSLVGEGRVAQTSISKIINSMAGREISQIFPERNTHLDRELFRTQNLAGKKISGVTFSVQEGEVLGIAGLAGSGRSEILRIIAGAQQRIGGSMALKDEDFAPPTIGSAHSRGVALVPQERRRDGLTPGSILANLTITSLNQLQRFRIFSSHLAERKHGQSAWTKFDIRGKSLSQNIFTLSGGNQQKVVLAKFLGLNPVLLLIDEPTKGVDVATRSEIYRILRRLTDEGAGIILVSSELTELLAISHRILVMNDGRQVAILQSSSTTEREALEACYGRN